MAIQPTVRGPEQVAAANPPSSLKVHLWYLFACLLPFTLAVFAPYPVGQARSYRVRLDDMWDHVLDHPAMIATGWALFAVGLIGTVTGSFAFSRQRQDGGAAARRWNTGAWTVAVIVGLFGLMATAFTNSDYAPPRDAAVSSARVPIGAKVDVSRKEGRFTVLVESIQCDWWSCHVTERVTNTGATAAKFPCEGTRAVTAGGETVDSTWLNWVTDGYGCTPPNLGPGESASVDVELFDVNDRQLVTLIVPGADERIDLPDVDR